MVDVTDATFETAVLGRSEQVPVVVDLWAPWCGPCRTLGPIIEQVVADTDGRVELAKVNIDENPRIASTFKVQSIPAVFAIAGRQVVDSFIGALPERDVRAWVERLAPPASVADELAAKGDEASLREALEHEPGHVGAVVTLAEMLADRGEGDEALSLLARIPETAEVRRIAAKARVGGDGQAGATEVTAKLDALLDRVKDDEAARQEFLDLLELLGADDPRTSDYRRQLTSRLF